MSALLVAAVMAATPASACPKTFSAPMIERAIAVTYDGTGDVSGRARAHLRRYIHCARAGVSRARMRKRWHRAEIAWRRRRATHGPVIASYYDLGGIGSCGVEAQAGLRFASLFLPCGTRVEMCHHGCVVATMADHGPYVAGRAFDLNVNLKGAIGCPDLCSVTWRRL